MFKFLEQHKVTLVYIPLAVYWVVLLAATSFPTDRIPSLGVSDKIKHFGAYLVLAALLNLALMFQNKWENIKDKAAPAAVVIATLYGILDEIHQIFIPGRSAEFLDFIADMIGALAGVFIIYLIKRKSFSV